MEEKLEQEVEDLKGRLLKTWKDYLGWRFVLGTCFGLFLGLGIVAAGFFS